MTAPAPLTRRMRVTRPSDSGSRPVGTTKLAGSFRGHRPRRCCAGVLPPRPWVDMLCLDRLLQPGQLSPQVARAPEAPVEQRLLEPAVEVLDAAVELRLPGGDKHGAGAEAQAQPDHPRQGTCRRPPAGQLPGVVELHLLGDAEVLPELPEEPQDLVHAAGLGQAQADGAVEGVLAHPDVVAVTTP